MIKSSAASKEKTSVVAEKLYVKTSKIFKVASQTPQNMLPHDLKVMLHRECQLKIKASKNLKGVISQQPHRKPKIEFLKRKKRLAMTFV